MKRVFLISYQLDGVTAGPSVRFQRYAPIFIEKGYRLTFITKLHSPDLPKRETRKDYDVLRIQSNTKYLKHTLFIFKAIWYVCRMRHLPEALLTFSCNTFQLWLFPVLKLRGVKLIYISTMDFDLRYRNGNGFLDRIYNHLHFLLYRILYLNMHAIVTSSTKLSESFQPFQLPAGKVVVIHNGVDMKRFHPVSSNEKQQIRQKLQLPEVGRVILYAGLKTERKGLLDLYEAWKVYCKKFPSDHLVLVGDEKQEANPSDFNRRWEEIKQEINNNSTGIFLRDNTSDIEFYFQAADLFIFLSHKEGMPNVLLEAMACGLPVILTAFQGFSADYGVSGQHILVVERDTALIAMQIEAILNSQGLYQRLSSNALTKVKEIGDINKGVEAYIRLFGVD